MGNSADLLFELGTEELPPVALKSLSNALCAEFQRGLEDAGLSFGELKPYATPRRLALTIESLSLSQPDQNVERRGPAVQAAFDADGNATKAAEGFARSCGVTVGQLDRLKTDKGEWLNFCKQQKGKLAIDLLPEIAENALAKLPIPKRMRWGSSTVEFVRPVQWLLFLLGSDVVPCTILDAKASNISFGHRFHYPKAIRISTATDYAPLLKKQGHVLVDYQLRRAEIHRQIGESAAKLGGTAEIDEKLLDEVTALVEWPSPIVGSFEARFLEVPNEALILSMKKNQKYFHLVDASGALLPYFITISNIVSSNPEAIKSGNERVIRPRLADAQFFWQQDGKKRLEDHLSSLKKVVFQKQLGSLADKSERIASLAGNIADQINGDRVLTERAARLSRCDLMTEMVNEFADMQGIMGRYQATRDGEPAELATAMDEFYMPRFSGDQLPQSRIGIAIALADRLDTLVAIFGIGQRPTGTKDPFALRRAALAALRIMLDHALPLNLKALLTTAKLNLADVLTEASVVDDVHSFMLERLKGIYAEQGFQSDLYEAIAATEPDSLIDFDQRIKAVAHFQALPEAASLAAANKRISNILKKSAKDELPQQVDTTLFDSAHEQALFSQIEQLTNIVTPLFAARDYEGSLRHLSQLKEPIDLFFDNVMVMTDDIAIRNNRLALLNQMRSLFLQVADISKLPS
ncbi:MAG: glycine--tRNA ligase subunit beta [Candidatus Polarisedimenticolaceae bacterium]|nr:glycine--tRNA ligase subunit beta [Candidatus Polarisedimenticolaceae bacterium]